jgi:hypothetical protein
LDDIISSLPVYMMIGIVVVVGISQFNRIVGGILGVIFWVTVLVIGLGAYDQGGAIGLPKLPFPRELFIVICIVFVGTHAYGAYNSWRRKGRKPQARTESDLHGGDD